ncbi:ATP-dependent RNA helicase DEAH13-like [Lycium barbarum]|uniref:ATP-dependent RNA helicase DEAH13-like n=1 Tax=Lycium barbarum TaxID=112863 RepID=UPI00293EA81F|nr:ATP-dependent RNA helicase DEAH13-like [Lycium barbarum]XP_060218445.1 ATP-dependent RNA helicase DEAH13-like [Lycium barbarum]
MERSEDMNLDTDIWSLNDQDSNAIILPDKKKKKKKGKEQVSKKLKPKNNIKLSQSQKKKLKKIEEDKEKAILLAESIKTLKKHQIQDDLYSLMWSSRNLGQGETSREKRRREVQYSRAGLDVPHRDRPVKKRTIDDLSSDVLQDSEEMQSSPIVNGNLLQSSIGEGEVPSDTPVVPGSSEELACQSGLLVCGRDASVRNKQEEDRTAECLKSDYDCHKEERGKPTDGAKAVQNASLSNSSNSANSLPQRALTTPTVVHVSRPKEVENNRSDLPIVMMEQEIMEAINDNTCVIVCGETGCGKTTQVPQFLYEAGYGTNHSNGRGGIIGVTQPRRVAVLATAKRVAFELGLRLGKEVGFQVRHDRRIGDNCSIKFMTDGILLRELQNDFLLRRYSILILDEAHERSLNTDILIGMLSRIVRERQKEYEEQQKKLLSGQTISPEERVYPLKLVLMSATLRVEDFISGRKIFCDPPPVMEVPTRQYPVTVHFSKRTEMVDYVGQAYKKILSIHKRLPPGGILVFVTGQREVEYLCQKLRKASKEIVERASKENNELSLVSEGNAITEKVDKEISEAFDVERSSVNEITERFNTYDEDHGESYEDDSEVSYDSADDSDLDVYSDDAGLLNPKSPSSDGKLDVLGEEGSLASLKAAFEALAGKRTSEPDSCGKELVPITEEGAASNESEPLLSKVRIGANGTCAGPMCVLPLYAMLPASAQLRVFDEVKEGERLIVVATNVAETSLTIPGIKYVVDTGREKVKKYNSSNGMEAYEIQFISKASAAQRAGRAGRTGPGHCYRLYSSAVFNDMFFDFSNAEILKVPVDGVVLLLKSMHIDKVANFPFPTPPEPTALVEAERCLKVLEALDSNGRLTPLGKAMAQYPMSPRHSRMLLTVIQIMQKVKDYSRANTVLAYAVAAAAALSLSNPFLMELEGKYKDLDDLKQDEKPGSAESERDLGKEERKRIKKLKEIARVSRAKFSNPTSDVLTVAYALQCFELSGKPLEFCKDHTLHLKTMEEMSKLRKQLINLVFNSKLCDSQQNFSWPHGTLEDVECVWRIPSNKCPLQLNEEEILGQAICAGWADRVAKRIKDVSSLSESDRKTHAVRYQACLVKEIVFLHRRSSISRSAPQYLVYTELLHTKRPYIQGATSVKENWLIKYAPSLCSFSAPLSDPKPYYDPLNDQVLCWVSPTFGPHLWKLPLHCLPIEDDISQVAVFTSSLLEGKVLPCLKSVQKFLAASPAIILKPEASGLKRVGSLLNKMRIKKRRIDSCAKLRKLWDDNPRDLFSEILNWFQEGFHDHFEDLWAQMQLEVLLDPKERFSKKVKREKRKP